VFRILVGKPERKRPPRRPRRRREDNKKIDLKETGWDGMEWVNLAEDWDQWRTYEHGNEPSGPIEYCEILK
jgi:hypothetical protein